MSSMMEQRRVSIGAATALFVFATLVTIGLLVQRPTPVVVKAGDDLDTNPLPGGVRVSVDAAVEAFSVPVFRPQMTLGSDSSIAETWLRTKASPQVWIEYTSGIVVYVRPMDDLQPTREFAEAQLADGVPGRIVRVEGVDAFVISEGDEGVGVRLVIDNAVASVISWHGEFSETQLLSVAESIVKEASAARGEHAAAAG
jgi:hypothetical protein